MSTTKEKKPQIKLNESHYNEMLGLCYKLYFQSDDITREYGLVWYNHAILFVESLANECNLSFDVVNHCLCVLSNANDWETNKKDCTRMVKAFIANESIDSFKVSTYGNDKRKAWNVLKNNIRIQPSALKTYSFSMNISNIDNHFNVTIDRHMLSAMLTREYGSITPLKYSMFRNAIIEVANTFGIQPKQMQAILWLQIKINKEQITLSDIAQSLESFQKQTTELQKMSTQK
tara:strand:- start:24 stop:719 length:696 start_codon:yes stop_codon:yes gene_type:complete